MLIRPLSPELQVLAETELNEISGRREQDLVHIKDWLSKQRHLHARTDDQWLLTFLRGCKYSLKKTKEKLDMYYTVRTILPEFFINRDPFLPELQEILDLGMCFPLPTPDTQGRRVFILRPGVCHPLTTKYENMLKINYMNMDIILSEDDHAIVAGEVTIIDLKGLTMHHAAQLQPSLIKKATTCYQEAYPVRPKLINIINVPPNLEPVLNFCLTFVKDEIKNRIIIHKNGDIASSLHNIVQHEILPIEYGGCAKTIQEYARDWKIKVEQYREWFQNELQYHSNEQLRTSKIHVSHDLFGLDGSFRQLHID